MKPEETVVPVVVFIIVSLSLTVASADKSKLMTLCMTVILL